MIRCAIYNNVGEIEQTMFGPEAEISSSCAFIGMQYIPVGDIDLANKYVTSSGVVDTRPQCPAQLTGTTLSNIPLPAKLTIDGEVFDVIDSSTVDLNFSDIGIYKIKISSWPYLDKEFEVAI